MFEETKTADEPAGSMVDNITHLPETIHNHAIHLGEQTADMIAKRMTEQLVTTAKDYLASLLSQKQSIENSTSNLAVLMQRVNIQKSFITRMSEWYGQKTWFEKASLGVMFVAAVSLLGAIVNLAIVFGVLALGLYGAITSILQEHYDINITRDERFCSGIRAMEESLAESVEHLKELEGHLRIILIELAEKNVQSAEHLLQFEKNIRVMNEKIVCFEQVVTELERIKLQLTDENAQIKTQLNTAYIDLEAANHTLIQRNTELDSIQREMSDTNQRIADKTSELNALCEKFQADSKTLSVLIEGYERQLQRLSTNASVPAPDEGMNASMRETVALRKLTDESIAKDNELMARIRLSRQARQDVSPHHASVHLSLS